MAEVIGVPTAVAGFIGYTETAPAVGQPVFIGSFAEFEEQFGGPPPDGNGVRFALYESMRLFYANGGGDCYVVSAGDYSAGTIDAAALLQGLAAMGERDGPTMLAIPELALLDPPGHDPCKAPPAYGEVMAAMLQQCAARQDRVAILDVFGADDIKNDAQLAFVAEQFRVMVGHEGLSYGIGYFPFVVTAEGAHVPASGAMAGLITRTDNTRGVWSAPANEPLDSVAGLTYALKNEQQAGLIALADGKAIDVLREFPGRGIVPWGARTPDGNSADYRYIQIRRTVIYIEQSIKNSLMQFVFASNDSTTWAAVVAMISNFLQGLWSQGALQGSKPQQAFNVQCGLGTTMTEQDIQQGVLLVQVGVALLRPAEFVDLTFTQQMAVS